MEDKEFVMPSFDRAYEKFSKSQELKIQFEDEDFEEEDLGCLESDEEEEEADELRESVELLLGDEEEEEEEEEGCVRRVRVLKGRMERCEDERRRKRLEEEMREELDTLTRRVRREVEDGNGDDLDEDVFDCVERNVREGRWLVASVGLINILLKHTSIQDERDERGEEEEEKIIFMTNTIQQLSSQLTWNQVDLIFYDYWWLILTLMTLVCDLIFLMIGED